MTERLNSLTISFCLIFNIDFKLIITVLFLAMIMSTTLQTETIYSTKTVAAVIKKNIMQSYIPSNNTSKENS
jgi:hypothetical protein